MGTIIHELRRADCPEEHCSAQHIGDPGYTDPWQPFRALDEIHYWLDRQTWRTREGEFVDIVHMTDSHLSNTIRFLRRNDSPTQRLSLVSPSRTRCSTATWHRTAPSASTNNSLTSFPDAASSACPSSLRSAVNTHGVSSVRELLELVPFPPQIGNPMTGILMRVASIQVGRKGMAADMDAAQLVYDLVKRGQVVTIRSNPPTPFSLSVYTVPGMNLQFRPHWYSEDARLLDDDEYGYSLPDWAGDIRAFLTKLHTPTESTAL